MTSILIISGILIFVLLVLYGKKSESSPTKINNASSVKKSGSHSFKLCSPHSIDIALSNIEMLTKNNETDKRRYKSYRSLNCSMEDLKRSFYFLKDCVYLCKYASIYNNKELLSHLSFLEADLIMHYIDIDPRELPFGLKENNELGIQMELEKNLGEKQLVDLELINWRSSEHWEFWADKYGIQNSIGQFCLKKASQ